MTTNNLQLTNKTVKKCEQLVDTLQSIVKCMLNDWYSKICFIHLHDALFCTANWHFFLTTTWGVIRLARRKHLTLKRQEEEGRVLFSLLPSLSNKQTWKHLCTRTRAHVHTRAHTHTHTHTHRIAESWIKRLRDREERVGGGGGGEEREEREGGGERKRERKRQPASQTVREKECVQVPWKKWMRRKGGNQVMGGKGCTEIETDRQTERAQERDRDRDRDKERKREREGGGGGGGSRQAERQRQIQGEIWRKMETVNQ